MKIAHLLGSLNRGGTETLMLDLFRNAGQAPFTMIGVYRKGGNLEQLFLSSGIRMFRMSPANLWGIPAYLIRLRKVIQREQVQIVHTHQRIDAIYAGLAVLGTSIRVVQTFHEYACSGNYFEGLLIRQSLRVARMNLFVSDALKQSYRNHFSRLNQDNAKTIYNGIDFSKFTRTPGGSLRQECGAGPQTLLFGMVGNFVEARDQLTICRFLTLLEKTGVDFHFFFIGKKNDKRPEYYETCVNFCTVNGLDQKVTFAGLREEVPALLLQMDAFIYATRQESFGIAVAEAIAAGIPVFASDHPAILEVTRGGTLASLFKTGDAEDLLMKFRPFLQNPAPWIENAKSNGELLRELYSIENHISELDTLYKSTG